MQVRICGKVIPHMKNLVCGLPPNHGKTDHAAVAIDEEGNIYGVASFSDGTVQAWQLVGPPE